MFLQILIAIFFWVGIFSCVGLELNTAIWNNEFHYALTYVFDSKNSEVDHGKFLEGRYGDLEIIQVFTDSVVYIYPHSNNTYGLKRVTFDFYRELKVSIVAGNNPSFSNSLPRLVEDIEILESGSYIDSKVLKVSGRDMLLERQFDTSYHFERNSPSGIPEKLELLSEKGLGKVLHNENRWYNLKIDRSMKDQGVVIEYRLVEG